MQLIIPSTDHDGAADGGGVLTQKSSPNRDGPASV